MITPETLAKSGTEHAHQTAFFCWAASSGIPALVWMHAIPNGGERNPIVAANLKAEGVKTGVWDVFLPVPIVLYSGMYIEFKKPGRQKEKNGGLSDKQVEFGIAQRPRYFMFVAYAWDEAAEAVRNYLAHGDT